MPVTLGRVLIIAGSDSGGGAGIQGDIKTVTCLGGFAATAITALTAQNTTGVYGIHSVPPEFVAQQIRAVLEDIGADVIKTGMLSHAGVIEAVAASIQHSAFGIPLIPLIVDPVMVAKGGAPLLEASAVAALKEKLFPLATLVTPNIPEAELLADIRIQSVEDMAEVGRRILDYGCKAVLVKGGHFREEASSICNLLVTPEALHRFSTPRIHSRHTHGTGCALASAIATFIAQGKSVMESIESAQAYVHEAIAHAPGFGAGHGPLRHNFEIYNI